MRFLSQFVAFALAIFMAIVMFLMISHRDAVPPPTMAAVRIPETVQSQPEQTTPPMMQTIRLDQIPENQEMYVTWQEVLALNQKMRPAQISYSTVQDSSHFGSPQWTLIRFQDGFYVRGYRIHNSKEFGSQWFCSTRIAGYDDCRSETVPLSDLKALSGPPEMTDGEKDNIETVSLPE